MASYILDMIEKVDYYILERISTFTDDEFLKAEMNDFEPFLKGEFDPDKAFGGLRMTQIQYFLVGTWRGGLKRIPNIIEKVQQHIMMNLDKDTYYRSGIRVPQWHYDYDVYEEQVSFYIFLELYKLNHFSDYWYKGGPTYYEEFVKGIWTVMKNIPIKGSRYVHNIPKKYYKYVTEFIVSFLDEFYYENERKILEDAQGNMFSWHMLKYFLEIAPSKIKSFNAKVEDGKNREYYYNFDEIGSKWLDHIDGHRAFREAIPPKEPGEAMVVDGDKKQAATVYDSGSAMSTERKTPSSNSQSPTRGNWTLQVSRTISDDDYGWKRSGEMWINERTDSQETVEPVVVKNAWGYGDEYNEDENRIYINYITGEETLIPPAKYEETYIYDEDETLEWGGGRKKRTRRRRRIKKKRSKGKRKRNKRKRKSTKKKRRRKKRTRKRR
jgi:hypothetical protein